MLRSDDLFDREDLDALINLIDVVEKLCQKIAIIKKGKIQCVKTLEEIEATGTTLEQFYLDIIGDNEDN